MKIKVTHKDKSVILDIPADKVMVILADAYSYKTEEVKDCIDTVSFIKDCGDIVEIKCSEDGDAALFYNSVWITDFASSYDTESSRVACGYAVWVGATGANSRPEGTILEEQFLRHEGGFDIVTTPRAIVHAAYLTEQRQQVADAGNFRSAMNLGSFTLVRGYRLSEDLLEEVYSYLKAPREEKKDYSNHCLDTKEAIYFISQAHLESDWNSSINCISRGYWNNVGLFYLLMK